MNVVRDGFQGVLGQFFLMWNSFMDGSTIPAPDKDVTVTSKDKGIHLHGTSPNAAIDEDFDNNLLLTSISVTAPDLKIVTVPTYTKTADGLVVSALESTLTQPPSNPEEGSYRIEYSKAGAYLLPSHVIEAANGGGIVFDMNFNACQANSR